MGRTMKMWLIFLRNLFHVDLCWTWKRLNLAKVSYWPFVSLLFLFSALANGTPVTIYLSGTLYGDEGVTPLAGQTIRLVVEGVSEGTATTDASGAYSIVANINPSNNVYIPLIVFVDNGTVVANAVTVMDTDYVSDTINDLDLYADHLIVRQEDNKWAIDNGDLGVAVGSYTDSDILYSAMYPDLTVLGANTELYVPVGHLYDPIGNVVTPHLKIVGTLNAGSSVFTVSGNWDHSNGTFNYGTSTVDFTGTGTVTVTGAWWTKPFYNVNAAAAGRTTTIAAGIDVKNVLTLGSGTLAGGNVNLSLDSGTPLVSSGANITSSIKFHPNGGGPINVAGASYSSVWLAGNAVSNTFNLTGNMSCTTLTVSGSRAGTSATFDTAGYAIDCNNLVIGSSANQDRYGSLLLNSSIVNVSADVTINASDTNGTNEIDAGSATINVGGNWTNDDTFIYSTSSVNFTGSGTISNNAADWFSTSKWFYNVDAAAAGQTTTISATSGIAVENILTLGAGTLAGGKVYLNKDGGTPLVTAGATLSNSLFRYQPSTTPVNVAATDYPDLVLASKGASVTFLLSGNITSNLLHVLGNSSGTKSILDTTINNYSINCTQLKVGNSSVVTRNGSLLLNGSTVTVNGNVFIYDGAGNNSIDAGNATINVKGDWTNNDTFVAGTSSVVFTGTGQGIFGSTGFYDFTKVVTSADTLTFAAGTTQNITGTVTLQGSDGQLLALRSGTPGMRWNLNLGAGATKAISHVDVQDSDASGSDAGQLDINPGYSVDSGNNVRWFGSANVTVAKSSVVLSDPVNGTLDPKRIPGAVVEYTVTISNTAGAQATDITLADDLSSEIGTVSFIADAYAPGKGIQLTAPNINGGAALALTNTVDADQGDYGATSANTVTVGGIVLGAGEQAMVKFRVMIQ